MLHLRMEVLHLRMAPLREAPEPTGATHHPEVMLILRAEDTQVLPVEATHLPVEADTQEVVTQQPQLRGTGLPLPLPPW